MSVQGDAANLYPSRLVVQRKEAVDILARPLAETASCIRVIAYETYRGDTATQALPEEAELPAIGCRRRRPAP